jgi:putative ABC transport system permease protein
LPAERYAAVDARKAVFDRIFDALRTVPGVEALGAAVITPLTGNHWTHPLILPQAPLAAGERPPEVGWQVASGGYFKALKIPLRSGRLFDETDTPESHPVVIVSDALVRRYFPTGDAVGKLVKQGDGTAEIVGVVGSIRRAALAEEPSADMYLPFERSPSTQTTLFVRTSGDPSAAQASIQRVIKGIEPGALLDESGPLEAIAASSLAIPRLLLDLLMVFAGVALVLAAIGIYGVTAYSVEQRTKEIGTRIALGAPRSDVYRLILGRGALIWLIGAVIGIGTALMSSRVLSSVLYATSPADPVVLTAVPIALLLVTLGACFIPARRAASVDPKTTLSES